MAVTKTLEQLFGPGTIETIDNITILKSNLKSNKVPPAFQALIPLAQNKPEGIIAALLLALKEQQDTSPDARFAVFFDPNNGNDTQLVSIISDGVTKIFEQYVLTVRFLEERPAVLMAPDPNKI
jgi:hypothetical protein